MDPVSENTVAVIAILSIFVLFPISISLARLIWRRASGASESRPVVSDDSSRRLMEMQQSLDALALEIERVSEGQRFVTKLLSERPAGELAAPPKNASTRRAT